MFCEVELQRCLQIIIEDVHYVNGPHHPIFGGKERIRPSLWGEKYAACSGKNESLCWCWWNATNVVSVKWLVQNANKYACKKSLIVTKVNYNVPEFVLIK